MASQHTFSLSLKSIVGVAVVALGLVILFGKLGGPATLLTNVFGAVAKETPELLPCFVAAAWHALQSYAIDHVRFSPCPLQLLASLWPLL